MVGVTTLAIYSVQPVLIAGLQAVLATVDDLVISAVCTSFPQLAYHVRAERQTLILAELTPEITWDELKHLRAQGIDTPIVIWVGTISPEFAAQAIANGVRGVLRRSLPIDLQIKCLRKVAGGELWVEGELSEQILRARQRALTPRESQLASLLAQGLKNKQIACSMGISEGSVKIYLSRLLAKVGAAHRFDLALFALKHCPDLPVNVLERLADVPVNVEQM
jgi:DNA-binding NarL/FixJ family response regulator